MTDQNIFGLHTLPLAHAPKIRQEQKTRIRKGEVVRETVWLDAQGNELEKISDHEFQVKSTRGGPTKKPTVIRGYPNVELQFLSKRFMSSSAPMLYHQPQEYEKYENDFGLAIVIVCMGFLFWFLAGYLVGRRSILNRFAPIPIVPNIPNIDNTPTIPTAITIVPNIPNIPNTPKILNFPNTLSSEQ